MKIYTKTGDDGTTGLQGGKRVLKSNPRIVAYGAVDEINSSLGVILSNNVDESIRQILSKIQNDLFVAGSELSSPNNEKSIKITSQMVEFLENNIDQLEKKLPALTNFILPGGHPIASLIHVSRTITRRAETQIISLSEKEKINENCIKYLNRLSDLLFVMARTVNKRNGIEDVIWKP